MNFHNGGVATGHALDVYIDGIPLRDRLELEPQRTYSLFESHPEIGIDQTVAQLRGSMPPTGPDGRVMLYATCHICGGLACGVVAVRVEHRAGRVIWHDFAHGQPDSEDTTEPFKAGTLRFAPEAYDAALAGLRSSA